MSAEEQIRLEIDNTNLRSLLVQAGLDKAEQETARRLMRVVFDELHHRLKNNLAIVTAIVRQSLRNADNLEDGRQAIETRLTALSRAHDVLLQGEFAGAKMADIIRTAIEPFTKLGADQFVLDLPEYEVTAATVLPVTLIFNELCTNATKYGALSTERGRVHIKQKIDPASRTVQLFWQERDGPTVETPSRLGFGTKLMNGLASQMSGHAELSYNPGGFACELKFPEAALSL